MTRPLPCTHAIAEPWLAYLQALKTAAPQYRGARVPGGLLVTAPAPRTLASAAMDAIDARRRHLRQIMAKNGV